MPGPWLTNWFTTGFDASAWGAPSVYAGGQTNNTTWPGPLLPDLTRIVETVIAPVAVTQTGNNYMVDLGKVYSGMPVVAFTGGASGTTISMLRWLRDQQLGRH